MGQATDPLGRPGEVSPADYSYAQSDDGGDYEQTTREIEHEIEQTRAEMSETINAIQERLSPQHIATQAKEAVYDATIGTAKGVGSNMIETIKRNPIPAAIAALSIGWLFRKSTQINNEYDYGYDYSNQYRQMPYRQYAQPAYQYRTANDYYGASAGYYNETDYQPSDYYDEADSGTGVGERISEAASQVKDQARHIAGQAQDAASQVRDRASELRHDAVEQVEYYGDQIRNQAGEAADWMQQTLHERPMVLGAVAFAIGTAVGMTLPNTPVENRVMGEARDSLLEKVQETAQQTIEKVQDVAQDATQSVKETLQERAQGAS